MSLTIPPPEEPTDEKDGSAESVRTSPDRPALQPSDAPPDRPSPRSVAAPSQSPPTYPPIPTEPRPYASPPRRGTNGFAIASLVLGILGGAVLSVIFGFVALSQIRRRGQAGRGLAITGIALSCVWIVLLATVVAIGLATQAGRDSLGRLTSSGHLSTNDLRVTDCLQDVPKEGLIVRVQALPCATPHLGEVFALHSLQGDYPGEAAVFQQSEQQCLDSLRYYSPSASGDASIELYSVYPSARTWREGDRRLVCIMTFTTPRTGSMLRR